MISVGMMCGRGGCVRVITARCDAEGCNRAVTCFGPEQYADAAAIGWRRHLGDRAACPEHSGAELQLTMAAAS